MTTHETRSSVRATLDALDRLIINRLQEGFPITARPFADVAQELGCGEQELIERLRQLREARFVTRFGPFFDAAAMGGAFCLCAMAVPDDRFDTVAKLVNALPEVAHNYKRDHALNMWFVLAARSPVEIGTAADRIERETQLEVLRFPKLEEFFIGFKVAA